MTHTDEKPCPACRLFVKGSERDADFYWCDPKAGGCAHFHVEATCPEITPAAAFERPIIAGYCQCGCGRKTSIAPRTVPRDGHIAGEPVRFIRGHRLEGPKTPREHGYLTASDVTCPRPGTDRRNRDRYIHTQVVERILGRRLPKDAVVHHIDGDKTNNTPANLVACQDRAYHNLLHYREMALKESGNPNWRRCRRCGKWDDPKNLTVHGGGHGHFHAERDCPVVVRQKQESVA